jgi:hypothetical protein
LRGNGWEAVDEEGGFRQGVGEIHRKGGGGNEKAPGRSPGRGYSGGLVSLIQRTSCRDTSGRHRFEKNAKGRNSNHAASNTVPVQLPAILRQVGATPLLGGNLRGVRNRRSASRLEAFQSRWPHRTHRTSFHHRSGEPFAATALPNRLRVGETPACHAIIVTSAGERPAPSSIRGALGKVPYGFPLSNRSVDFLRKSFWAKVYYCCKYTAWACMKPLALSGSSVYAESMSRMPSVLPHFSNPTRCLLEVL